VAQFSGAQKINYIERIRGAGDPLGTSSGVLEGVRV